MSPPSSCCLSLHRYSWSPYLLAGIGGTLWSVLCHVVLPSSADRYQLEAIPAVGFSDPILSYFTALRFIFDGFSMLKQGYETVNSSFFMI